MANSWPVMFQPTNLLTAPHPTYPEAPGQYLDEQNKSILGTDGRGIRRNKEAENTKESTEMD